MKNRQLYTIKFKSSRLKKYNYDIKIDYKEALENGEIIALSDNQMLRTIRKVVIEQYKNEPKIKKRILDKDVLEEFYDNIEKIKKEKNSEENIEKIQAIKQDIIDMCYIPEYITIVMEHDKHYEYLYENGLKINDKTYFRISTSAGKGRSSTVTFCSSDILESVNEILDNGRDKTKKFSPSKFNAYKGLYESKTQIVTTPRFCVVPDYFTSDTFDVNWVTETPNDEDDKIETKTITKDFNRSDGMGLITPTMAKQWSEDLGLDYMPCQYCVRQSFIKGMLCVFDTVEFCKEKNNGSYLVNTIYKDKKGQPIKADLREIDVILTEGQFKLWNSFISLEQYKQNCIDNELMWGVSLYVDKELTNVLRMNYQFLQVTDIPKDKIPELCDSFVKWIKGVNSDDIWYTLLFLMGTNVTQSSIKKYLESSSNWWIKSLIVNHQLLNDKYIKQKIYNLIKKKIDKGCLGTINLDGNYEVIVSDPYGLMEAVCGLEVHGLISKGSCYSQYWNNKNVSIIDCMRAPLTYRSEHVVMSVENTEEQRKWFKYCYGGIIINIHGHETDNFAGSDFDFDILASTSNEILINSVYKNENPVVYEPPTPNKIVITDQDLYKSDLFSFGSIIGAITNKSTTGTALLKYLEETKGIESREYKTILNRLKMCTKLQSAQIDKAKIGREVKGIPRIWTDRQYINKLEIQDEEKTFLKSIMLDRHPYFFIHLYPDTKRKYKKYIEKNDLTCKHKFGITLNELLKKDNKTDEEAIFIKNYDIYMPIVDTDSVMNNICKYIESVDFDIKNKICAKEEDTHNLLMRYNDIVNQDTYNEVITIYKDFRKQLSELNSIKFSGSKNKYNGDLQQESLDIYTIFKNELEKVCSNVYELVDYLIKIFYEDFKGANKDILWNCYGNVIFENIKIKSTQPVMFPFPNKDGDIEYLNENFKLEEVIL
jgi:hypothetical protein